MGFLLCFIPEISWSTPNIMIIKLIIIQRESQLKLVVFYLGQAPRLSKTSNILFRTTWGLVSLDRKRKMEEKSIIIITLKGEKIFFVRPGKFMVIVGIKGCNILLKRTAKTPADKEVLKKWRISRSYFLNMTQSDFR